MRSRIVPSADPRNTPIPRQELADPEDFRSILFDTTEAETDIDGREPPGFFTDLNLDQIVASITAGRDEYNLRPFFHVPLKHVESINYRYDVLRDLENHALFGYIQSFSGDMRRMRDHLAQADKSYYKRQKQRWFLDAVEVYCNATGQLNRDLALADLRSRGFLSLRAYLASYVQSNEFTAVVSETRKLSAGLDGVRYSLHIKGKRIMVSRYGSEPDYSVNVLQTFDKFRQRGPKEYHFAFQSTADMNHVEAAILDRVAQLYPELFSSLDEYCGRRVHYLNKTIARLDREIQFYIASLEYIQGLKKAGLRFCYPSVSARSKEVSGREVFDLALANKLTRERAPVVTNDFYLRDPERIFVVSGPNQGGKTTFARAFAQLHYLAAIGCPVPGSEAQLFLFDQVFTHFEREEDIRNLSGKLEDELLRIHKILERATSNSILIMNESFLSTTLDDALSLSKRVLQRIIGLDMLCLSVTFLDELASLGAATVSMVSTVNPKDPALRTFKIVRRPANGLAYAAVIAAKYGLAHDAVKARVTRNARERATP